MLHGLQSRRIFCNQRHFSFPMQIDYHKTTACFLLFFYNQRRGKLDSSGPWHPAGRPLDILRARSSHHVKPTSAHINQAYFSPYYLLWASTDADRIVLFLSDHVCTSRSIRFIAGAKMTPSRHFWCPVCVDLCFLNTARTQFAFDVNDNIDRL